MRHPVILLSKLNDICSGYFDPKNAFLHSKHKLLSELPKHNTLQITHGNPHGFSKFGNSLNGKRSYGKRIVCLLKPDVQEVDEASRTKSTCHVHALIRKR